MVTLDRRKLAAPVVAQAAAVVPTDEEARLVAYVVLGAGQAVEPDYPDIARQQGAVGTTQVKVTLDATGNPVDVSIYKSSGNAALDQSAMKAARATQYNAETQNCDKIPGSYIFRADFTGE